MPFSIIRNNLTAVEADAIVNTANPDPIVGSGVDSAVHAAAGPRLLEARKKIGPIPVGSAAITGAYRLRARYVIHTAGPMWQGGGHGEAALLRSCYDRSLELAWEAGCKSIAFPLISAGNYHFPGDLALSVANAAFRDFLETRDMDIRLVVFDRESFALSRSLFRSVASFITEAQVQQQRQQEYGLGARRPLPGQYPTDAQPRESPPTCMCAPMALREEAVIQEDAPMEVAAIREDAPLEAAELSDMLESLDAGFSETLLHLIDLRGKTDAQVYKKANIDRKLFSKIRKNPGSKPSKPTAVAFAVALELDYEETLDFLGRAGYTLSHSSKFDIIIEYFIRRHNYNIFEINETLFAFDQSLLGAQ